MQKWEYMMMEVSNFKNMLKDKDIKEMNRLGENGWEAYSKYTPVSGGVPTILFKRPLP